MSTTGTDQYASVTWTTLLCNRHGYWLVDGCLLLTCNACMCMLQFKCTRLTAMTELGGMTSYQMTIKQEKIKLGLVWTWRGLVEKRNDLSHERQLPKSSFLIIGPTLAGRVLRTGAAQGWQHNGHRYQTGARRGQRSPILSHTSSCDQVHKSQRPGA